MKYWMKTLIKVVIAIIITLILSLLLPHGFSKIVWPIVAWGSIIILAISAWIHVKRDGSGFDLSIAVYAILTTGMMLLMMGFCIGLSIIFRQNIDFHNITFKTFEPMIWPFIEGMIATALAQISTAILKVSAASGRSDYSGGVSVDFTPTGDPAMDEHLRITTANLKRMAELSGAWIADMQTQHEVMKQTTTLLDQVGRLAETMGGFFKAKD